MGQLAKRMPPSRFDLGLGTLEGWGDTFMSADAQSRLQVALLVSFLLHLFVVVGVTVQPPDKTNPPSVPSLEVVLVNSKTATAPQKPDQLAQANLDGGGNTDAERRARSPLPMTRQHEPQPDVTVQSRQAEASDQEARRLMTQTREQAPAVPQPEMHAQTDPKANPIPAPPSTELLASSMEFARQDARRSEADHLMAEIDKDLDAYKKRPRRKSIGASTQEFRFARYVEDWRSKIERVGTLNYPQAARDQRIYGTLRLTVSIRRNGSVESVEINRSSGQKVLDEAAIRIVRLAAPFAAFPPGIAQDTDVLSITRTWTFTREDQFQAE